MDGMVVTRGDDLAVVYVLGEHSVLGRELKAAYLIPRFIGNGARICLTGEPCSRLRGKHTEAPTKAKGC